MTHLLQGYATSQAATRPDALAIIAGKRTLTYGQLEEQSNRFAHLILQSGCKRGDRVCLFLDKSPAAVTAMHGVMKADCVYVPIDTTSPPPRVLRIVESCRPHLILADSTAIKLLDAFLPEVASGQRPVVGCIDSTAIQTNACQSIFDASDLQHMKATAPESVTDPDDPAHILFTSGSTGAPKGVVLSHRNVTHFVDWGREHFGIDCDDRVSGHPPLHFDLSTFDIYGSISAGAQLHMVPAMANLLPNLMS